MNPGKVIGEAMHKASRLGLQALACVFFLVSLASNYTPAAAGIAPWSAAWCTIVGSLVALELGAIAAAFALWPLVRRFHVVGASCAAALLALCLAVSIPNAMQFAWGKHQANAAAGARNEFVTSNAEGDVNSLRSKLSNYATVRATKDIERAESKCGTTKACKALAAEKVRAGERDALVSNLTAAEAKLADTPPAAETGDEFAQFATALKLNDWTPATWDLVRALAYVLFLQLSAPLCAILSGCVAAPSTAVPKSVSARAPKVQQETAERVSNPVYIDETPAAQVDETAEPSDDDAPVSNSGKIMVSKAQEHLLKLVNDAGGKVDTSTRKLSEQLGMNPTAVRRGLKAACAAGMLVAVASKSGTTLWVPA